MTLPRDYNIALFPSMDTKACDCNAEESFLRYRERVSGPSSPRQLFCGGLGRLECAIYREKDRERMPPYHASL